MTSSTSVNSVLTATMRSAIMPMTDDDKITLVWDMKKDRPGCVIVQACADLPNTAPVLAMFDGWVTSPNENMRKITGTVAQWKQKAKSLGGA